MPCILGYSQSAEDGIELNRTGVICGCELSYTDKDNTAQIICSYYQLLSDLSSLIIKEYLKNIETEFRNYTNILFKVLLPKLII